MSEIIKINHPDEEVSSMGEKEQKISDQSVVEDNKKVIEPESGQRANVQETGDQKAGVQETEDINACEPKAEVQNVSDQEADAPIVNDQNQDDQIDPKIGKRHTVLYIILALIAIFLILVTAGYFAAADYFKTHFLPGTTINGMVCDYLQTGDVVKQLEQQSETYTLTITGKDGEILGTLTTKDVGMKAVGAGSGVEAALTSQDRMSWPLAYLGKKKHSHEVLCDTEFDQKQTSDKLAQLPAFDKSQMKLPQNAYIGEYQSDKKGYEIIPEVQGNALNMEAVEAMVLAAVDDNASQVDLYAGNCYLQPEVTAKDKALNDRLEELNLLTGTLITYDWNGSEVILDGDTIHQWIIDEETLIGPGADNKKEIQLDEEAVAEFVAAQAKKYDTYGKHRKFTTTLGETIDVLNGGYGWKTDKEKEAEELVALIREGTVTEREPVWRVTAKQKGTDDIGSSYVEIDLSHQHLYLYWKGSLVLETDFVSGNMANGWVTPGGLYRLTYKTTNAVLRGRDYVTPVSYWMPFNGNIGMHDATWRNEFGGDIYLTNGSHGCVNLPLDKAQTIYAYVSTGFPIICYYY